MMQVRVLFPGSLVMVRRPVKWSAGVVSRKLGPVTYVVEMADGRIAKRHIDQLRARQNDEEISSVIEKSTVDDYTYPFTSAPTADTTTATSVPERRYPERSRRPPNRFIHDQGTS